MKGRGILVPLGGATVAVAPFLPWTRWTVIAPEGRLVGLTNGFAGVEPWQGMILVASGIAICMAAFGHAGRPRVLLTLLAAGAAVMSVVSLWGSAMEPLGGEVVSRVFVGPCVALLGIVTAVVAVLTELTRGREPRMRARTPA